MTESSSMRDQAGRLLHVQGVVEPFESPARSILPVIASLVEARIVRALRGQPLARLVGDVAGDDLAAWHRAQSHETDVGETLPDLAQRRPVFTAGQADHAH